VYSEKFVRQGVRYKIEKLDLSLYGNSKTGILGLLNAQAGMFQERFDIQSCLYPTGIGRSRNPTASRRN
jgi:hypothetical protein